MTKSFSTRPALSAIPIGSRGFCTNADAEKVLTDAGIDPLMVWRRDREVECMTFMLASDRGRKLPVYVAEDLTIFGEARKDIFAQTAEFERRGIPLRDVRDLSATLSDMQHVAQKYMSSKNAMKDRRTSKKRGKLGGEAKGLAAQQKREALDRDGVLTRLFNHKDISFRLALEIAGPTVKASSARRHFKR